MLRKILVIMLGCLLPVQANADSWFFQTQVRSGGGSMTSANKSGQRVGDGAIYRSYTSSGQFAVSVVPDGGYKIRNIVVNSTPLLSPAEEGTVSSWPTIYLTGGTDQTVTASFIASALKICPIDQSGNCASSVVGYHVTPSSVGGVTVGYKLSSPITFTYTPTSGYQITGIPGLPNDPTITHTNLAPGAGKAVKVTFPAGYVFSQDIDLQATAVNNTPFINQVMPQNAIVGAPVSLNVSTTNMTGVSYSWTYVSGPANTVSYQTVNGKIQTVVTPGPALTLSGATSAAPSFVAPSVPGQYKFTVQVKSDNNPAMVSLATVNVVASGISAAKNQCQFCHTANGIGGTQLFSNWSASAHKASSVTCAGCHAGAGTGGHPGSVTPASVSATTFTYNASGANFCVNCHSATIPAGYATSAHKANGVACASCHVSGPHNPAVAASVCGGCHYDNGGSVPNHLLDIGTTACTTCHNPHNLSAAGTAMPSVHYNNMTGAKYPASYVTSRASCADCHRSGTTNQTVRHQWYSSAHAAVTDAPFTEYDFKTRSGCVQCHTTTGFVAYSTGKVTAAWGDASDKTKEVITCRACHSDISNGTARVVQPVSPYSDLAWTNREAGASNLCFDCHSGRNTGNGIQAKVGSADFTNLAYLAPHYLSAGGTLNGKTGYSFGQTYSFYSTNSHRTIGMANFNNTGNDGQCVACHMPVENGVKNHYYQAVAKDANGTVTSVPTSAVCGNCHGATLTTGFLNGSKTGYANTLNILKLVLGQKGYAYTDNYPYFANTNWGSGQAGANNMGAAFNYKLLLAEPGAYAHNGAYARKLLVDSIDAVYHNGSVTGQINDAVTDLFNQGLIDQATVDSVTDYAKGGASCTSCHANTSGSHTTHIVTKSIGCVTCHSATAASNTALIPGTQKHANGVKDVVFAYEPIGSYASVTKTCSNVSCHSDGMGHYGDVVWGAKLTCKSCHPNLTGAHQAHIGSLLDSVGFYGYTSNNSTAAAYQFGCANCHPTDPASHQNGKVDVTLVADPAAGSLRAKNSPTAIISGVGQSGSGIAGTSGVSVTCSAAYCHSNGRVGGPLAYATSPDWYNAAAYTGDRCAMCHGNAPATGAHAAHAVGIHYNQITDASGNLILGHGDETQSTTINCDLCHSVTVTNFNNDNNATCGSCHVAGNPATGPKGTPTVDKTHHLNGTLEVAFKGINMVSKAQVRPLSFGQYSSIWTRTTYKAGAGSYDFSKQPLSSASFDATGKNCSNVACHNGKSPNWNAKLTCVDCHSTL
ncbi:CxxxxCH/CxxCH domain c-type cytochrome [Geomesophilobacter sediminis]|uniref:CxxxxCH/CxxCH domain-containing protein n=1 Tax=Geomesophilobacter sediminis TaxID=2798584 RepID=A0A8J7IZX3_9BACT|nr:CxxxxCH/CxxCH domain-containing protein [Geomesophilobacter sediminis]MBJ6725717.1 CxxxxCH/CxxCH domain-containing protein [Geomesophilobacter sediminis]